MKKKQKQSAKKRTTSKSRVSAKAKLSARSGSKKSTTKRKRAVRRKPVRENEGVMGSQSVETVPLSAVRPKARSARAGASGGGGGDYSGLSVVAGGDSVNPTEVLEEWGTVAARKDDAVQKR